jgi:hypothetical protein
MAQFRLHLTKGDQTVKTREIRVFRVMHDGETQRFSIDLRIPKDLDFDQGAVDMWNAGSTKQIIIDDLSVIYF